MATDQGIENASAIITLGKHAGDRKLVMLKKIKCEVLDGSKYFCWQAQFVAFLREY